MFFRFFVLLRSGFSSRNARFGVDSLTATPCLSVTRIFKCPDELPVQKWKNSRLPSGEAWASGDKPPIENASLTYMIRIPPQLHCTRERIRTYIVFGPF